MDVIINELSSMYQVDKKVLEKAISKAILDFDGLILPEVAQKDESKNQALSWLLAGIFLGKYDEEKSA